MVYLGLLTCVVAITFYVILLHRSKTKTDEVAEFVKVKSAESDKETTTEVDQ